MKPPKSITVGPHTYTVAFGTEESHPELHDVAARTTHEALSIVLDEACRSNESVGAEVLLHEVLHCVMNLTGAAELVGFDQEEVVVASLAPMLLDTLRRNPKLVALLIP